MTEQSELFAQCCSTFGKKQKEVLLCITKGFEEKFGEYHANSTAWLLTLCGAIVFFMQLGFAMLSSGCVRRKNVSNTLLKNLLDSAFAAFAWFTVGFAFAFGGQNDADGATFIGTQNFFLTNFSNYSFFFYEYCCSASAVTIIAGTLSERCRMSSYIAYSLFMVSFCYPVVAHAIWSENGFLSPYTKARFLGVGCFDFAGSGVVHVTGGTTALIAAYVLGARKGRFHDAAGVPLAKPKEIPGHSISLQVMGTLALWFGWFGFNAGGALVLTQNSHMPSLHGNLAALTAVNTALGGAAGATSALLTNMLLNSSPGELAFGLTKTLNGTLTGLVSITAGCGLLEPWAALLVGVIGGWISLGGSKLMVRWKIDDAVDGIPVHLGGGLWGMLAVGLFASPAKVEDAYQSTHFGFLYTLGQTALGHAKIDASLLACQVLAALFILGWVSFLMFPLFLSLNHWNLLRTDTLEEIAGLDACYQVATQEDNDELKVKIKEEFEKFKIDRQRAMNRAGSVEGPTTTASSGSRGSSRRRTRRERLPSDRLTSVREEDNQSKSISIMSGSSTASPLPRTIGDYSGVEEKV